MSSMTSKDIMFSISGGKTQQIDTGSKEEQDEETKQMGEQIQDLFTKMLTVKDENQYMSSRELQHSQINEATHANVLYWAIFQCLVVIFMSIGQVYYMKRFFEQKRMV